MRNHGPICNWQVVAKFIVVFFTLTSQLIYVESVGCEQEGVCACVFENGSRIDLSELGSNTGVPLMKDLKGDGDYMYSFNPCFPFNEGTCLNVAGCQTSDFDLFYAIGDASSGLLTFNISSGYLVGRYTSTDELGDSRTSYVSFICDATAETPKLEAFGETSLRTYTFAITSKHACVVHKPTPPKPTKSCHTNYGDFIKRCEIEYDGHEEPVKVLFIRNWNGICKFPSSQDIAVTIYSESSTCAGVANRCHPAQQFSVNGEFCKEIYY
ncbi:uncharacterized protein LOC132715200 isoform X1 [Ruditapes philippinarum]|uniref:uncharacterized protein LOC132715200 isoform X1 n=1 Tax=Ruditapes philippinarum TaxID=129788 RepID=UPI00295AF1B8|nr:uncharacterized protein LOC132715200 isoform X1 [Ruditapes philippinarum]